MLWHTSPFDKYPHQVCFNCDSRAVDATGARTAPHAPQHFQPVFVNAIKCWRLYDQFDGAYVTMRDVYESVNLAEFLDRTGVNRCEVDSLTPEDIRSVIKWLPRLREVSRPPVVQSADRALDDPLFGLMYSCSALAGKVMDHGSDFSWPDWQPVARLYVEAGGSSLESATLETCVRLLITHVRKDRFCGGHFREMVEIGHIEGLLSRLDSIHKSMPGSSDVH
jgi:hypothetical protein